MPRPISSQLFLNVQPIQLIGSPLRQRKKRIRLTRARSRRMVANATSTKLKLPCFTAKKERAMDGTIRKRKTETSTSRSFELDWALLAPLTLLSYKPFVMACFFLRGEHMWSRIPVFGLLG